MAAYFRQVPARIWNSVRDYLRNVYVDYKTVLLETAVAVQQKPHKGLLGFGIISSMYYAYRTNPSLNDFICALNANRLRVLLLSDLIRNPTADQYLNSVMQLFNEDRIRWMNCVFFTVIYRSEFSRADSTYEARCKILQPRWWQFHERVVDVGAFNLWFKLDQAMIDYDVNAD